MMLKQGYPEFKASLSCKRSRHKKTWVEVQFSGRAFTCYAQSLGFERGKCQSDGKKAIFWARDCLETLLSLRVPFFIGFLSLLTATAPLIEGPLVLDLWKLNIDHWLPSFCWTTHDHPIWDMIITASKQQSIFTQIHSSFYQAWGFTKFRKKKCYVQIMGTFLQNGKSTKSVKRTLW